MAQQMILSGVDTTSDLNFIPVNGKKGKAELSGLHSEM